MAGTLARCCLVNLLGLALLAGCDDLGTGPEDGPQYFPLSVGNTWTYAPEDPQFGDPFEWQVTERQEDTVTLDRPPAGSHPGPVILVDRLGAIDLVEEGGASLPFYRFQRGVSWVHRDPWECDDQATFIAVKETSPITTPAGTFHDCLRIERHTAASCTDAGTTFEWWAPGVGLVRWEELNFYAGGPLTFQLVSYSVG